jgi:hypothetical protein
MSQGLSMQALLPELEPSVQCVHPQQLQALQNPNDFSQQWNYFVCDYNLIPYIKEIVIF